jgi:hypothetical protein
MRLIGSAAGIPSDQITAIGAPDSTGTRPVFPATVASAGGYKLDFEIPSPTQPLVSITATASTRAKAVALANGAATGLGEYLNGLAADQAVPTKKRIDIRELGGATVSSAQSGFSKTTLVPIYLVLLTFWCGMIIFAVRFAEAWRRSGEEPTAGLAVQPHQPVVHAVNYDRPAPESYDRSVPEPYDRPGPDPLPLRSFYDDLRAAGSGAPRLHQGLSSEAADGQSDTPSGKRRGLRGLSRKKKDADEAAVERQSSSAVAAAAPDQATANGHNSGQNADPEGNGPDALKPNNGSHSLYEHPAQQDDSWWKRDDWNAGSLEDELAAAAARSRTPEDTSWPR